MGKLLILLALGFAAADKLDRTYLPPPDAQYSGGNPEDLQIPLEFPKEASDITSVMDGVPDNSLLKSGYYIGSTLGPNIGQNIETSSLKSPLTYFSNTSPMMSLPYIPTTTPSFDYETTNNPLDISQDRGGNAQEQQTNQNYRNPFQNFQSFSTSSRFSENSVSDSQYPALYYGQSFGFKYIQPEGKSDLRNYLSQNGEKLVLRAKIDNTQSKANYGYKRNKPFMYGQEVFGTSANSPEYITKSNNYLSNDIRRSQYAPDAKIMDNNFNYNINKVQNKQNAIVPTSNLELKSNEANPRSFFFSKKSRPLSSSNEHTPGRTEPRLERPQAESNRNAITNHYHNSITPVGYSFSYHTSNGISANESGTANNGVKAQGAYSYTGDDGKVYRVVYTADENGFQPRGDHLPLLPVAIQRLIEKAAREKDVDIIDDGSYNEAKYGHKKYQGAMEQYHPEFQGFTNNGRKQFGYYARKPLKNTDRPISTTPTISRQKYNNKKQSANQDKQATAPSNQGNRNYKKPLDMSFTKSIVTQKTTGEALDKAQPAFLDETQRRENLVKEGVTQKSLPTFPFQQGDRSQINPINLDKATIEYSPKQSPGLNKNIPEIIASSQAYTEHDQGILGDEQDGYFYTKPQNKFIENAHKERTPFNSDQELEIGDDDIITVSVPLPSTNIRSNYHSTETTSLYNVQSDVNTNQEVNSEIPSVPIFTVDSTTPLSSDIIVQTNQPSLESKAETETFINPAKESRINEYYNDSLQPQTPTVQDLKASPNILEDGYGTLTDENIYGTTSSRGFYGQSRNSNLPKTEDIVYDKNSRKGDDINISKGGDIRLGYSDPLKQDDQFNRILGATSKYKIIGEDFSGPTRPQSFDIKTGYHY